MGKGSLVIIPGEMNNSFRVPLSTDCLWSIEVVSDSLFVKVESFSHEEYGLFELKISLVS